VISEKQLALYFHSFWQEQFPFLNSVFVRRFNYEHEKHLHSTEGAVIPPASADRYLWRADVTAELAFELIAESKGEIWKKETDFEAAAERALNRISRLHRGKQPGFSSWETEDALTLVDNYVHFFGTILSGQKVEFRPRIKGAGILDQMEADFCTTEVLVEVKTVHRRLQSSDLRQLICYLVAGLASRRYAWKSYCIFNPRRAVYYVGQIHDLLAQLSGRPAPECISSVIGALMEGEQLFETTF
jgi:hypothetical protein